MNKFKIRKPLIGEKLHGTYPVIVDVNEKHIHFRTFSLHLDGISIRSSVLQPPSSSPYIEKSSVIQELIFTIDIYQYVNGQHTIEIHDHSSNSEEYRVVYFENVVSAVWHDPIFVLYSDIEEALKQSQIRASVSPAQKWAVEIQDSYSNPVKTFHGCGDRIEIQWHGHNDNGQIVDDDQYELIIRALQSGVSINAGGIIKSSEL